MAGRCWLRWVMVGGPLLVGSLVGCTADDEAVADETSSPELSEVHVVEAAADTTVVRSLAVTVGENSDSASTAVDERTSSSEAESESEATGTSTASPDTTGAPATGSTRTTMPTGDTQPRPGSGAASCGSGTSHCVGPSEPYRTLTEAAAAAGNGAVIELTAGRYLETVAIAADNVTIRSPAGNRAIVDCSGMRPAKGKACILAVGTNLTVENLVVTGARGPDDNEACFRNEPGTRFVVRGVECYGSNNGILGSGGSWLIENSYFHDNGAGDGQSHNLYFSGDCSDVVFRGSRSVGAIGGHAFKSRCRTSTIENSELVDNTVADAAEFSNGGVVTIRGSQISQPAGPNGNIVRHGAEGCTLPGTLTFVDSTISSGRSPSYIRSACGPVTFTGTPLPAGVEVDAPS